MAENASARVTNAPGAGVDRTRTVRCRSAWPSCLRTGALGISALLYSCCSLLVKELHARGWPIAQLMCVRIISSTIVAAPAMAVLGVQPFPRRSLQALSLQALLAVSGVADLVCYFTATTLLPLGDATAIIGLYPACTALLARRLLNERLDCTSVITILLATTGGICIARPHFLFPAATRGPLWGYIVACCGCLLTSTQYLIMRHPALAEVHPLQSFAAYLVVALPSVLTLHLATEPTYVPSSRPAASYSVALAMGLLGMGAQGLIFTGGPHVQAAYSTLIGSSEILWSYCWQILLHEPAHPLSLVGAALILLSFTLPVLRLFIQPFDPESKRSIDCSNPRDSDMLDRQEDSETQLSDDSADESWDHPADEKARLLEYDFHDRSVPSRGHTLGFEIPRDAIKRRLRDSKE